MAESICEIDTCTETVYNYCGECGLGTCEEHSIPVPEVVYEEGYVCPTCSVDPTVLQHVKDNTSAWE